MKQEDSCQSEDDFYVTFFQINLFDPKVYNINICKLNL